MSEKELCDRFAAAARLEGWTVYPEQSGFDMVLARHGVQVGVEAKLVASIHMLLQALPAAQRWDGAPPEPGPHYRMVLFERAAGRTAKARRDHKREICELAQHLRLIVAAEPTGSWAGHWLRGWPEPNVVIQRLSRVFPTRWRLDFRHYRWRPPAPLWLPPFVPDLPAGVPCPRSVSPWSIAACELEKIYRARGWICLDDARKVKADQAGSWRARSMLTRFYRCTGKPAPVGRQSKWEHVSHWPQASEKYPEVWAEVTG